MRFLIILTIAFWSGIFTANAYAGEQASSDQNTEMCSETICQHDIRVVLKQEDGSLFDETFEVMPGVVQPNFLVIIAGQSLSIEADRVGNQLLNFKVVDQVKHPEKTLTASLKQSDDGSMLLKLTNPFNQALKFDMGMMLLDSRLLKTSSCPIAPRSSIFESWPHPIFQIVLANPRFIDLETGKLSCE